MFIQKEKAEYKSAKRSRLLIREAFLQLLSEKSPDQITVTDIVKKADINRGTFYAHYKTPHDIIVQIAQEVVDEIQTLLSDFQFFKFLENPSDIFEKFNNYLNENKQAYQRLVSLKGSTLILQRIREMLLTFIIEDKTMPQKIKDNKYFIVATDFFINAIIYTFKDFIEGKIDTDAETTIETLCHFIIQNSKAIMECPDIKKE